MTAQGDRDEHLLDRWLADAAVLAPEADRDLWLHEGSLLLSGWNQEHRAYHTTEHLTEMLAALDELTAAPDSPAGAEAALLARTTAWYHDLHHDPRATAGANEHRSATMARDHLHRLGVAGPRIDRVEAAVLMTAAHDAGTTDGTDPEQGAVNDLVHDADLWILSSPPSRYATYRTQVRHEYASVPADAFRAGRLRILQAFATRDRLYRTAHAHRHWTGPARANLAEELADLAGA